ncbi:MAG: hypothetical protein ACRD68_18045, partial [Pyrinomonadaceae bacterium]
MRANRRRPSFTTPFAAWRKAVLRQVARPFNWLRPSTRFVLGLSLLTLVSTLLLARTHSQMPAQVYGEGDVVRADVISPADIAARDVGETERRRETAVAAARPVWSYDPARGESAAQNFRTSWDILRQQAETRPEGNNNGGEKAPPKWPGAGGDDVARAIVAHRFD